MTNEVIPEFLAKIIHPEEISKSDAEVNVILALEANPKINKSFTVSKSDYERFFASSQTIYVEGERDDNKKVIGITDYLKKEPVSWA